MKPNTDRTSPEDSTAARPLADALFAAESVAHLRGYEREILPLADLARSMGEDIAELRAALVAYMNAEPDDGILMSDAIADARAVLAKTEPRKQP
jgi:hypothetical protein